MRSSVIVQLIATLAVILTVSPTRARTVSRADVAWTGPHSYHLRTPIAGPPALVSAIERQAPVVAHAVLGEPAGRHGAVYVEPTSRGDVLVHAFSSDSASVPQLRMIFGERAHGPGLKRFALSAPEGRLSHSSYPVARAASRRGALQEAPCAAGEARL
jgi:hypothetical protein